MSIKTPNDRLINHISDASKSLNSEYKSELLKSLKKDSVYNNSEQDRLLIKLLEDDLADGGIRFENLYYASNSFYG